MTSLPHYLVQRRLPGIQGDNGCYSDVAIVQAASAADALAECLRALPEHMVDHGFFRVALAPEWETFRPRVRGERTVSFDLGAGA